jgi:lysophospholipid acyltransferase (LPLAT)-like uncharacterized protein
MPIKDKLIVALVTTIIWLLKRTIRWNHTGSESRPENTPCIVSCWHSRLLLTPFLLGKWQGPVIISDHHDGVLIAAVYENFGVKAFRGSSSKGGARALLKLIRQAKEGASPGITPDGPRGPAQVVKEGVAQIAIKSCSPVLPVCYATSRQWRLSSWDAFYVPKPFSKGIVVVGEPLFAEDNEGITDFTKRIQQAMDANQQQADHYFQQ